MFLASNQQNKTLLLKSTICQIDSWHKNFGIKNDNEYSAYAELHVLILGVLSIW